MAKSKPPIQYAAPAIHESVPFEIRRHLQFLYNRNGNHAQAFQLLNDKVNSLQTGGTVTTVLSGGGGGGGGTVIASSILIVDDQTGVTSYQTQEGDNGALVVLNDASPVAVTLAGSTPPYGLFLVNQGTGLVTLTPAAPPTGTSTISYTGNPGASSMPLLGGQMAIVAFDGSNWWAGIDTLSSSTYSYRAISSATTITASDYQIEVTAGTFTQPLPTATGVAGKVYSIKNSGTGIVTISTTGGQLIDGIATQPLSPGSNLVVMSNGTGYLIQ